MSKKPFLFGSLLTGVALVVGLVLGNLGGDAPKEDSLNAGGATVNTSPEIFAEGLGLGKDQLKLDSFTLTIEGSEQEAKKKIDFGGKDVWVKLVNVRMINDAAGAQTASSTFEVNVATSSSGTLATGAGLSSMEGGGLYATSGAGYLPFGSFLDSWSIATSTTGDNASTTTNGLAQLIQKLYDGDDFGDVYPGEWVNVADANSIHLLLTSPYEDASQGCDPFEISNGNVCERATSTNRGFNLEADFLVLAPDGL